MSVSNDLHLETAELQEQIRAGFEAYQGNVDELVMKRQEGERLTVWREPGIAISIETDVDEKFLQLLVDRTKPQAILNAVAEVTGTPIEDIVGSSRKAEMLRARHAAVYVVREQTELSYTDIARLMGYGDHTSAINAYDRVRRRLESKLTSREFVDTRTLVDRVEEVVAQRYRDNQIAPPSDIAMIQLMTTTAITSTGLHVYPTATLPEQHARALYLDPRTLVLDWDEREAPEDIVQAKGYMALRLLGLAPTPVAS